MTAIAAIKQIEVTRYAKAMQAAGIVEWRLEVKTTGDHVLVVGNQIKSEKESDWD